MKLNVGCGLDSVEGYHNLDNSLSLRIQNNRFLRAGAQLLERFRRPLYTRFPEGVRYCDVTRSLPYRPGSVELVYSSHLLEHLARQDAEVFLSEAHRVLVPGGVLRLAVPDCERKVREYLGHLECLRMGSFTGIPADEFMRSTLLGLKSRWTLRQPKGIYRALFAREGHAWMWDAPSLIAVLRDVGFSDACERGFRESRIPEIEKLELEGRREESVYVEAQK